MQKKVVKEDSLLRIGKNKRPINDILYLFSVGRTDEQIIEVYSELKREDLEECRKYLAEINHVLTMAEIFVDAKKGYRPYSTDFRWYAVDSIGEIAVFTTAGFGAIQNSFFADFTQYLELEQYLNSLDKERDYQCVGSDIYIDDDYIDDAKRGFYSYDYNTKKGWYEKSPYSLLIFPKKPINISDLSENKTHLLKSIQFKRIMFREEKEVLVEDFFTELNL